MSWSWKILLLLSWGATYPGTYGGCVALGYGDSGSSAGVDSTISTDGAGLGPGGSRSGEMDSPWDVTTTVDAGTPLDATTLVDVTAPVDATLGEDSDGDKIRDDGDFSGVIGDNPCRGGNSVKCDDNCRHIPNFTQADADDDGVGDSCDANDCRRSTKIVGAGYDRDIFVSLDSGKTWNKASITGVDPNRRLNWEDVAHANGTWVISSVEIDNARFARSTDAINWKASTVAAWQGTNSPDAVGYVNGLWFLGSHRGQLAVSDDDGLTFGSTFVPEGWSRLSAIEDMAFAGGRLVIVGDGGHIAFSDAPTQAATWTTMTIGTDDWKKIEVANGVWVASGTNSSCYYSSDRASSWQPCSETGLHATTFYALGHLDETWMLGSEEPSGGLVTATTPTGGWRQNSLTSATAIFGDCGSQQWFAANGWTETVIHMSHDGGRTWKAVHNAGMADGIYSFAGN